ncbi:MAG: hypothetical protein JO255_13945 [Alphaproteobacteria bacterium]|nr:hypothetical protein [Alphaproteobacteria bacterium]
MASLSQLRIKARIYLGFGALIVIGLFVAGFGAWQLTTVGGKVDSLSRMSDNAARSLRISRLLETMRRAAIRYKAVGDDTAINEYKAALSEATEALTASVATSRTEERRRLYGQISGKVSEIGQGVEKLIGLVNAMKTDRAKLFTVGDQVTAATAQLVDAARVSKDPALTSGAAGSLPAAYATAARVRARSGQA